MFFQFPCASWISASAACAFATSSSLRGDLVGEKFSFAGKILSVLNEFTIWKVMVDGLNSLPAFRITEIVFVDDGACPSKLDSWKVDDATTEISSSSGIFHVKLRRGSQFSSVSRLLSNFGSVGAGRIGRLAACLWSSG